MNKDIKKQVEIKGLVINRLPSWAKTYIKKRAKEEFSDDYGQAVAYFIRMCEEYEILKTKFLHSELEVNLVTKAESNSEPQKDAPRSISGSPIKSIGGKNGKN